MNPTKSREKENSCVPELWAVRAPHVAPVVKQQNNW